MTIRALNHFLPAWFTPAGQKGKAPTRFKLRGLDGIEQSEMIPACTTTAAGDIVITAAALRLLLAAGLVEWENFDDAAGPVEFSPNTDDNQARIPYALQSELAAEIFRLTFIDPDVKKK